MSAVGSDHWTGVAGLTAVAPVWCPGRRGNIIRLHPIAGGIALGVSAAIAQPAISASATADSKRRSLSNRVMRDFLRRTAISLLQRRAIANPGASPGLRNFGRRSMASPGLQRQGQREVWHMASSAEVECIRVGAGRVRRGH